MRYRWFIICVFVLFSGLARSQGGDCHSSFKGNEKTLYEKALNHYEQKHFSQCIAIMKQLSAKHRESADVYFYLGAASLRSNEKPGIVRAYFNRLFKVCPDYDNALAYFYMGIVEYSYQQYDEAVANFNRYFEMTHGSPRPEWEAVYEEASNYLQWSEFLSDAYKNQTPFNPQVIRGPSSKQDELLPYFSLDGQELYFLRRVAVSRHATYYAKQLEEKVWRLHLSRWKDTAYTFGEELPAPFNQYGEEGGVTMTADNNVLYYSIMMPEVGYNNCDIYYAERKNGVWQTIENAGRNVNGKQSWESQPSITPDGRYLYFASDRAGGYGGTDIWRCRRLPNGDWGRAENLGPSVNSPGNEKCPFIHADGNTLYFASNGWQGFGGYDMYFIHLNDNTTQFPTNLGLPINSEDDDICIGVSADGKQGYFANKSTEYEGIGGTDIYSFELYPAARPEEMSIVKGVLRRSDSLPLEGNIYVLHQLPEADCYPIRDPKGAFALALTAKHSNIVVVLVDGCLPIVLQGNATQIQRDITAASFVLQPEQLWGRYELPVVPDKQSEQLLSEESKSLLEAYANYLLQHPKMHLRIEATSLDMAKAIYDYFVEHQLRAERFEYKAVQTISQPRLVITQL